MPAVFKVSPDGTESTVNSHVDMDTSVKHDTSALFHLRLGKSVLGVENRSYDSTGQFNYRGTDHSAYCVHEEGSAKMNLDPQQNKVGDIEPDSPKEITPGNPP